MKEPKYITLVSYRKKGINAYMVKEGEDHTRHDYGTPIDEENQQLAYRSKRHTVQVRIDNLDGVYRYREAGGADFNSLTTGYLLIENGEITEEADSAAALIAAADTSELPELEGSVKQVGWAESIREKIIAKFKQAGVSSPAYVKAETSAKWYIDNRNNI